MYQNEYNSFLCPKKYNRKFAQKLHVAHYMLRIILDVTCVTKLQLYQKKSWRYHQYDI